MPSPLVTFLSSTVEDLGPVRDELAARLRARGIQVLVSEDPGFPVLPGVTSHDACLAAVRSAHLFVLLIGLRFGGEYQGQGKSITWREWEEAIDAGVLPIVLVHRHANELARQIFARRRALAAARPAASVPELDRELAAEFPDRRPLLHNLPGIQRFIDAVRKGHRDNWMYAEWTGTADDAMRFIDSRLNAAFAAQRQEQRGARGLSRRQLETAYALHKVAADAAELVAAVRSGERQADAAALRVLSLCEARRFDLLDFREHDLYSMVLYRRAGDALEPCGRASHPELVSRGRTWRIGEGHIGRAVQRNQVLVGGDLRQTAAWVSHPEAADDDQRQYVSAISIPLHLGGVPERADAAFTITSSRIDHFRDPAQVEVLTAMTLGSIISSVWLLGAAPELDGVNR